MKTITVRGIEEPLAKKLKQAAGKQAKSVNRFIIDMLRQNLGLQQKEKKYTIVHHDLDHLFGKWTKDEFNRIRQKIERERKIDKELWG